MAACTHARSEAAEKERSPRVQGARRRSIEQSPADVPERPLRPCSSGERRPQIRIGGGLRPDVLARVVVGLFGHIPLPLPLAVCRFKQPDDRLCGLSHIVTLMKAALSLRGHAFAFFWRCCK